MVLPEPDMPLTTTRRVAALCTVVLSPVAVMRRSPRRLAAHLVRLPVEEGLGGIDALGLEHVVAHRGLDQHGEVAARRDRDRGLRHLGVEYLAVAVVAVDALQPAAAVADRLRTRRR